MSKDRSRFDELKRCMKMKTWIFPLNVLCLDVGDHLMPIINLLDLRLPSYVNHQEHQGQHHYAQFGSNPIVQ